MDPDGEDACEEKREALNDEASEVEGGGELGGARLRGEVTEDCRSAEGRRKLREEGCRIPPCIRTVSLKDTEVCLPVTGRALAGRRGE